MIAYNQVDLKNKNPTNPTNPTNPYNYLLGFIHGFTICLIPLSLYIIKRNKF